MNLPLVPPAASNFAAKQDAIFNVITALTVFFTVVVFAAIIILSIRYRHGKKINRKNPVYEHLSLELAWSIIPLILALGVFAWGTMVYVEERTPPANAMQIFVVGKQWMWHIQHSNGVRENNELHVPIGRPVKLTMISQDVLHAFYVPEFRVQYHVVPGRYTSLWFTPTQKGTYHLFCNMYCGTQHSQMGGRVYVMSQPDFDEWLAHGGNNTDPSHVTMAQKGEEIFNAQGCANCHGAQDTPRGPSLYGSYGKQRQFTDGSSAPVDDDYVRSSIVNPYDKIVKGYERTMPANYRLTELQIIEMEAYIRSLGAPAPKQNAQAGAKQ